MGMKQIYSVKLTDSLIITRGGGITNFPLLPSKFTLVEITDIKKTFFGDILVFATFGNGTRVPAKIRVPKHNVALIVYCDEDHAEEVRKQNPRRKRSRRAIPKEAPRVDRDSSSLYNNVNGRG